MIILVTGFASVPGEATFDGRIWSERCDRGDADIQYFKAIYPRDEELLIGILTWLNCRDRPPTTNLTSFHWEPRNSSDELNRAIKHLIGCILSSTASEKSLLQFAKVVRLQGNERYKEGEYERAIDLYQSALLSLSK